jgi:hypothetical protein
MGFDRSNVEAKWIGKSQCHLIFIVRVVEDVRVHSRCVDQFISDLASPFSSPQAVPLPVLAKGNMSSIVEHQHPLNYTIQALL